MATKKKKSLLGKVVDCFDEVESITPGKETDGREYTDVSGMYSDSLLVIRVYATGMLNLRLGSKPKWFNNFLVKE